jgi:hypothetical protein
MQEELRLAQPNKADDRLAMRVVITLGDVLHEEGALVGDTVVLSRPGSSQSRRPTRSISLPPPGSS